MIDKEGFKKWLKDNTTYSDRTKGNIVSRLKRADSILPYNNEETYLDELSAMPEFKIISMCCRSQIRGAVRQYIAYLNNN